MTPHRLILEHLYRRYLGRVIHDAAGKPHVVAHIQLNHLDVDMKVEFYERSKHFNYIVPTIRVVSMHHPLPEIFPDPEYYI